MSSRAAACGVLLHGFGADRLGWSFNRRALEAIADIAAPDLPGHGDAVGAFRGGDRATLVDQIEEIVAGHAAGRPVTLYGHSLGAGLALALAERRPQQVQALFLIAPIGLGRGISAGFLRGFGLLSSSPAVRDAFAKLVANPARVTDVMIARVLAQLDAPGAREALSSIADRLLDEERAYRESAARVAATGLRRTVVWGVEDRINRYDAESVAAFGGQTHVIEGAGHLPHMEKASAVTPLMIEFLRARPDSAR